ncbi:hypothetical protein HDF13_004438 [Edaphobacter lichenicola]|uniref:Uncharacterized protein n=1 Tax=Tunturiibacter gelidiferens TaxID=3069689 RepID=A0ACC5P5A7_9BACT|nr:hypothetical protein [Edaphobacter lichenicola]
MPTMLNHCLCTSTKRCTSAQKEDDLALLSAHSLPSVNRKAMMSLETLRN